MTLFEHFIHFISKYPSSVFESACILIPLFLGIARWQRLTPEIKLMWGYTAILALTDIPLWWTALHGINNYKWVNIQEILIAGWLFYVLYKMLNGLSLKALRIIYLLFAIIILFDFDFVNYSGKIFSYNRLLFIGLSFMFFYELLEKLEVKNLLQYPKFWFFTGLLISSLGTLFMFVFTEYTSHTHNYFPTFRHLKDFFKYLFVTFITVSIFLDNRHFKQTI
ncbi:hypothetical protein [Arcticibacterium luteifluviistationis]|uniref:Uncharacterized protein n=1 Tax=Arcticibacterium luteifluviistationis TaxID=1784714 RepID=A0A2Z4GGF8_9BACT|nr:hypothetical protein [Arcticibacterium luteifluviistationis]AWW00095.1 hypothetical protein DJ013_18740 [Arcticibacterium luteifluviistationis]